MKARERTAYHEAGHAVIRYVLDLRFEHVSIVPPTDGNPVGHCLLAEWEPRDFQPDLHTRPGDERLIRDQVIALLAGPLAEKVFSGRANHVGSSDDVRRAAWYADFVTYDIGETEAYLKWLWVRTERLVELEREYIAAIAQALLERRTLSYEEVVTVIHAISEAEMEPARTKTTGEDEPC